ITTPSNSSPVTASTRCVAKLYNRQLARRSLQRPSTPSSTLSAPGNSAALVDVEQSPTTLVDEPPVSLTRETVYIVNNFKWHIVRLDPSSATSSRRSPTALDDVERFSFPNAPFVDEPRQTSALDVEPLRRAPTPRRRRATGELQRPLSTEFQAKRKPLSAPPRGFVWVRYQSPKLDTSAGQVAVRMIPDPKPVSGGVNSPTVAAGVLCRADQIVPPQSLRTAAAVSDVELRGAD